jgi:phenylacetate-CoA ligase
MNLNMIRRLLNQVNKRMRGNSMKYRSNLLSMQFVSREKELTARKQKLEKLLVHCFLNVPYYTQSFSKLGINNISDIDVTLIERLPILTKNDIKDNFDLLTSIDINNRKTYKNSTGGSTGEPLVVLQDKDYSDWSEALTSVFHGYAGYNFGNKVLYLWGSERDSLYGNETFLVSLKRKYRNEKWLNTFKLDNDLIERYLLEIDRWSPDLIIGYADSLFAIAKYAINNKIKLKGRFKVVSSAGTLFPEYRKAIESVFRGNVYNRYGTRELGNIAFECEQHDGLHISMSTHHVEILSDDGHTLTEGENGNIVVTTLTNYSMPLLRYKVGDMGVLTKKECRCGRSTDRIVDISGRSSDMIKINGGIISPFFIIHLFGVVHNPQWLEKFQVIQKSEKIFFVKLVINNDFDKTKVIRETVPITKDLEKVLGPDVNINYTVVDEIQNTESGKYRYVVCEI